MKVDESTTEAADKVAWELETATAALRVHTAIAPAELERVLATMSGKGLSA